ncbi:acylphosphatase [Anoxybacillus sp. B7M1]|jgi:acylphosphatase|uniref:Acylphosphatase n=1 Tax=Anoxybacteroides rupiense TaxID=311460 RepID=A0ABD5IZU8_9BACL|nr:MULTISPECIES: acylphosphatase [Anoxybacillus]ANB58398.1 acylphosphatase [Anoxybacillus sp. B2M1]ANB64904.1 acylphosphatase [Anoxybacillus sp. B7M1]KXG10894.1 Acylphosphatase [Anoxybacillus sp. P3H1B]MBB3907849.1 acylphosphatase [Anoxybacillus rupiensis]MBS2772869.1 acylphosphatase [Anoxybacillus rupiensis]
MKRLHVIVHGRVQGVGFRYYAQHEALKWDLTGWVKNNEDGTVELEAQGHEERIHLFIDKIRQGSPFSKVTHLDIQSIDPIPNEKTFRIIY